MTNCPGLPKIGFVCVCAGGGGGGFLGYDTVRAKSRKALGKQDELTALPFSQGNGDTDNYDQTRRTVFLSFMTNPRIQKNI